MIVTYSLLHQLVPVFQKINASADLKNGKQKLYVVKFMRECQVHLSDFAKVRKSLIDTHTVDGELDVEAFGEAITPVLNEEVELAEKALSVEDVSNLKAITPDDLMIYFELFSEEK